MHLLQLNVPPTTWIFYGFALFLMATANTVASVPDDATSKSNSILLAALSDQTHSAIAAVTLADFRVKRPEVVDFQFIDAVLALMLQRIGVDSDRDKTIALLNTATPGQKALYAVYLMRLSVAEFGFIGYFESTSGDLIPEVERGLKILGAKKYLQLFRKSLSIFKKQKGLITDSSNRQEILASLSNEKKYNLYDPMDEKFEQLEDELVLQSYIIAYVNENPRYFFIK
ncbi:MAG: DUF4375 domain-containing protein [Thiohalomonadales bacterium]